MRFKTDTTLQTDGDGYSGVIAPGWDIGGRANGGYLLALAGRAMAHAANRPHPVALNAHFLSPGEVGPVTMTTETLKTGRRFTTMRGRLAAGDRPLVELLGSFGDLAQLEGPQLIDAAPPELPAPEQCVSIQPRKGGFTPALMERMDLRLHPEDAEYLAGNPSGEPLFRGWLKLQDDEPIDSFGLLLATDAFPPTAFNAALPMAWVPTVELTAHIRGIPQPGWLRCRFSTRFITGGMLEEDGEIWDDSGRLVAQSRQLALAPLPR
jgi:acyl-CoA thioesterase